jgi:tetratricopeptide (TPR) repeat protein
MTTKNLQLEKGNFLWFKLFVEVLIHMKDNALAHHDLIKILRVKYPQSDFIADFDENYTADKAIEWFTRDDSCLLKELNKALRKQDLDHLFIFRYLINDIYQELKKEYDRETTGKEKIIKLYRSQLISQSELKQLVDANTGDLIAINSFMSTWNDRIKAIQFLKEQHQGGFKRILFEIEVDYRKKSRPFARINIKEQDLTLFMLGCIFRIRSISPDRTLDCYVLKLELCSDNDADFNRISDYMATDLIQPETDLITLGSLLSRMGELDKARKYFELILSELDENDPNRAHCLDGLGNIDNDQGKFVKALKHHQQALDLRMSDELSHTNHSLIALSHIHIADDYNDMGKHNIALENVEKARILIRHENLQTDQVKEAVCHIIVGSILYKQGKCIDALDEFQQALDINKQQGVPDDHPNVASIYQNMGLCHLNPGTTIHNPTLALDYCVQALITRLKALPHNHRSTGITYRSIGLAYEQLKEHPSALEFFQKANTIHKASNKTFNQLQSIDEDIKRVQRYYFHIASFRCFRFLFVATSHIQHLNKTMTLER